MTRMERPTGGVEEDHGLGGGSHHDGGRPRRGDPDVDGVDAPAGGAGGGEPGVEVLLPGADALAGPDDGLGPAAGRQLPERGDVSVQRPGVLLHPGADRGAQRGADQLAGRRAGQAAALDAGLQRGVAAGAGGGDGVVEVVNVAEDGGDVGDAEPVERDVPDARYPVQAEVPGIAAHGGPAQLLLTGEPFLQPPHDGGRPDGGVVAAADGSADPAGVGSQAEGDAIVAALPAGAGTAAMVDGAGHYPHAQSPDAVAELVIPFLTEHAGA